MLLASLLFVSCSSAQVPPVEDQIGAAILAAPAESREGATVLGFEREGEWTVIREGTNEMICLTDDPQSTGFNVACYHRDLDPYMARGRELRAQGMGGAENLETRGAEVAAGTLAWPTEPRTLYVMGGPEGAYDAETGEAPDAGLRFVVYVPYATGATTGLSEMPGEPGIPWLMSPGSYRAHIMIVPPRQE